MHRIIALAFVVMTFTSLAHADWKCLAICHYYLPNSSPTHPSLPPQAHESYVESWGATLDDAYRELQEMVLHT